MTFKFFGPFPIDCLCPLHLNLGMLMATLTSWVLEVILCDFCVWDTEVDAAFPVLAVTLVCGVLSR